MRLKCINPTKTITKSKWYDCQPVRFVKSSIFYNEGNWKFTTFNKATSFLLKDDTHIERRISVKRFET